MQLGLPLSLSVGLGAGRKALTRSKISGALEAGAFEGCRARGDTKVDFPSLLSLGLSPVRPQPQRKGANGAYVGLKPQTVSCFLACTLGRCSSQLLIERAMGDTLPTSSQVCTLLHQKRHTQRQRDKLQMARASEGMPTCYLDSGAGAGPGPQHFGASLSWALVKGRLNTPWALGQEGWQSYSRILLDPLLPAAVQSPWPRQQAGCPCII